MNGDQFAPMPVLKASQSYSEQKGEFYSDPASFHQGPEPLQGPYRHEEYHFSPGVSGYEWHRSQSGNFTSFFASNQKEAPSNLRNPGISSHSPSGGVFPNKDTSITRILGFSRPETTSPVIPPGGSLQSLLFEGLEEIQKPREPTYLNYDGSKRRYTGRLKFFDESKSFGFIVIDEDGSDIFVHLDDLSKASIPKDLLKTAKLGNVIRLSFSSLSYIGRHNQSRKAVDIQLISTSLITL